MSQNLPEDVCRIDVQPDWSSDEIRIAIARAEKLKAVLVLNEGRDYSAQDHHNIVEGCEILSIRRGGTVTICNMPLEHRWFEAVIPGVQRPKTFYDDIDVAVAALHNFDLEK